MTNKDLEIIIFNIRTTRGSDKFESDLEIDSYFKASILVFNNLKEPYWRGAKTGEKLFDDYFLSKMDVAFGNDKISAVNQLIKLWNEKNVTSIEYNLRGLEHILREANQELDESILELISDTLMPLKKSALYEH